MTDLHHVDTRHESVHSRLEAWGKWVLPRETAWKTLPMFRLYRPPPQWEPADPVLPTNGLECLEIERIVSQIPERPRLVLRYVYVFSWIPIGAVRRECGTTTAGVSVLLDDGRDMVKNKIKR